MPEGPPDHPGSIQRVKNSKPDLAWKQEVEALIAQGYKLWALNEGYTVLYKDEKD